MGTNMDEFYDKSQSPNINSKDPSNDDTKKDKNLSKNIDSNVQALKQIFGISTDIIYREFQFAGLKKAVLIFIDGFVDTQSVDSAVLQPLINYNMTPSKDGKTFFVKMSKLIQDDVIYASNIKISNNIYTTADDVVSGNCALLIDGEEQSIIIDLKKFDKRAVEEPQIESVIRGPREGFTENLSTNIILIRRRLRTPRLKIETSTLGRISKTSIAVLYIDNVVKESLLKEVKSRLKEIDVDILNGTANIEELIEDNNSSIFAQFGVTERPDRFSAGLCEGHVGILVDNTPMSLIAPVTFVDFMKSTEDYYDRYILSSLLTIMRYIFLMISIYLPAFYIALVSFHQGMIPRPLLLTIASSREGVPFPSFVELFLMQMFFEGLQEASTRLPRVAGQTVSIIGGLAIGQAAIQAGIVSAATVVVVTVTGIATFVIPKQGLVSSVRILRFPMLILSGTLGLYGIFIGLIFTLTHMAKLRSFGVPYLVPLAPLKLRDIKDAFVRVSWRNMVYRPDFMETKNPKRMNKKKLFNKDR